MQTKFRPFLHDWNYRLKAKYCLRVAVILIIVALPLLASFPALSADVHPDETPTITSIHVNTNLANDNDVLIYGLYNIPYDTVPTTAADKAFIFRLMSADGTTELGNMTPFIYNNTDNGYNKGVVSFYFLDGTITWETSYIIRIQENPSFFASPTYTDITIPAGSYTSLTERDDNQVELASRIYVLGQTLQTQFGDSFFQQSGGDIILTSDGETYFRGAIYGIQYMAPSLFIVQQLQLDDTASSMTTDQFDSYMDQFDGTWVDDSQESLGDTFGMNKNMIMAAIAIVPLCIGFLIFSSMKFRKAEPGYVCCSLIMIMGVLMGWLPTAVFASIYQICGIYIGYQLFYRSA